MVHVAGRSGSGTSYYTGNLVEEYKKLYAKNPVYMFSQLLVDKDAPLDKEEGVFRVNLNSVVDDPIHYGLEAVGEWLLCF